MFHVFSGTLANAFGFAISPDVGGQDTFVAFVDVITDPLTSKVVGDSIAIEPVRVEKFPLFHDIRVVGKGGNNIKVIAPTGEFYAIVAHGFDLGKEIGERNIGPLAGEKCDGSGHDGFRLSVWEIDRMLVGF
jgi:hypothetical protein